MAAAFFIQVAASGAAVAVLVGLAAWAQIARPAGPLDDPRARALLAEEFPGRTLDGLWIAVDGKGAVAKSGAAALVGQALAASFRNGRIVVDLADVSAPKAIISLPDWPPPELAKDLAA